MSYYFFGIAIVLAVVMIVINPYRAKKYRPGKLKAPPPFPKKFNED